MDSLGEPNTIAFLLALSGGLLMLSVLLGRLATQTGIPVVLIFLLVGMLAGSEGIIGIEFADYELAFSVGTAALAVILFDGGLNTSRDLVTSSWRPAGLLATVGVIATAGLVAIGGRLLGFGWGESLLLGAIVSSTDAAAVFSILRGSHMNLRRRVAAALDLESGLNDPLAVILTMSVALALVGQPTSPMVLALGVVQQLAVGAGCGFAVGFGGSWLLGRLSAQLPGLYPVLTLALAFIAFGVPTMLEGSGYLSVFVAGAVIGQRRLPYRSIILHAHDFIAWLAQVVMFLTMGLLVFPSDLVAVSGLGLAVALWLAVVARPLAVIVCLSPFGFSWREQAYVAWVGLRGAVPIILGMFPLLVGVESAPTVFNVVFFVVVVSVLLQGASARPLSRWLGVQKAAVRLPSTVVEISGQGGGPELHAFWVHQGLLVCGARIGDIRFPQDAAITMILRDETLIPADADRRLQVDDHVYVLCAAADLPLVRLMFGRAESDDDV